MTRTAVFDLDGTLLNSAPDIHAALNRAIATRGLPPYALPEVTAMIGDGVQALVTRALAGRGLPFDPAVLAALMADEAISHARRTAPFAGMAEVLDTLARQGWRMAVCTNKPEAAARALLGSLGLAGHFAAVGGGDSFPVRKPDPGHLRATLAAAGGAAESAVMIGDHRNDVLAAAGAGLPCIFAGWGYGTADMADGAPVAARPADLPGLLAALRP